MLAKCRAFAQPPRVSIGLRCRAGSRRRQEFGTGLTTRKKIRGVRRAFSNSFDFSIDGVTSAYRRTRCRQRVFLMAYTQHIKIRADRWPPARRAAALRACPDDSHARVGYITGLLPLH